MVRIVEISWIKYIFLTLKSDWMGHIFKLLNKQDMIPIQNCACIFFFLNSESCAHVLILCHFVSLKSTLQMSFSKALQAMIAFYY